MLKRHACVALLLAIRAGAADQPIVGVPWTGQPGITESVGEIMERERLAPRLPFALSRVRETHREIGLRELMPRRQRRPKPALSQWPPAEGARPLAQPFNPQAVSTSFLGTQLSESGFIPPDSMGDVGPTQVLVIANGRVKVFDKTGVLGGLDTTTDNFFASVGGVANATTDPHVRYDRLSGRWFVVMVDLGPGGRGSGPNNVLIAVSSSSTITGAGSFTFFQFQQDLVGTTPNSDTNGFADYPTLGVDKLALYVGANIFNQGVTAFLGTTGFVVKKADLLGGTLTVTAFRQMAGGSSGCPTSAGPFAPQGVNNDDPAVTEGYFIGIDLCALDLLQIRRVSTPGTTPTLSGNIGLTVPPESFPIDQMQPSPGKTLDALDDRVFAAMIHRNKITGASTLWTAHNIQVDGSGAAVDCTPQPSCPGGRNGSRWYEITSLTTTPTLVQAGTLFDNAGTNPLGYWIPSMAMSGQGHMALGSSRAGASAVNGFASVAVAGRLRTDSLGATEAPTLAQSSSFIYNVQARGPQRWGDFSQMIVDPTDDMTMWTFQEYCNAANSWGVRAIQLKAPPPATPSCGTPAQVTQTTQNVTITGTSAAGSEFFDPGPDTGGPGYPNRLQASVSGGVTVNSVTFNSPTSVTLNLTAAGNGLKDVTITNPDGQSVVGSNCINVNLPPAADLSITKTAPQATATPGQAITYTIVARNAGPNAATGATVADTVPASLTGATWTCLGAGGGMCAASGTGNINDAVNLPVNATVTYTLQGTVSANPAGLSNTATVSVPPGMIDPTSADNTATYTHTLICASETVVVPDGRLTNSVIGAGSTAWFLAKVSLGRSYSLELKNTTGVGTPPGTLTVFSGDDGCSGVSTLTVRDTTGIEPGEATGAARVSFTASGSDPTFRAKLVNASGSPIPYTFSWSETTMFGPAWSTLSNFNTYYAFTNTTKATITGTLTLTTSTGASAGTTSFTIAAGGAAFTNTVAMATPRGVTGNARFTHDGPPGAILVESDIADFTLSPPYIQPVKFRPMREHR